MDAALQMLQSGKVGTVALIGMGGVFLALLFLFFFVSILGAHRRFRHRPVHPPAEHGKDQAEEAQTTDQPDANTDTGAELAACVAVAWALEEQGRPAVYEAREATGRENSWRTAGRQALMAWPGRKSPGHPR